MSKLQLFILRLIFKKAVKQGPHKQRIKEVMQCMKDAMAVEFPEDSPTSHKHFINECVNEN
jgi:hypothetical protein